LSDSFFSKTSLGVVSPCLVILYLVVNLRSVFGVFYPGQIGHYRLYNHILPHHYVGVPSNLNIPCVQGFIQRGMQIHPECSSTTSFSTHSLTSVCLIILIWVTCCLYCIYRKMSFSVLKERVVKEGRFRHIILLLHCTLGSRTWKPKQHTGANRVIAHHEHIHK
jgi:hypothetical protein